MGPTLAVITVVVCWVCPLGAEEPRTFYGKTVEEWSAVLRNASSTVVERRQAIHALAAFGPEARAAVPCLIEALGQKTTSDASLLALSFIGAAADHTVPLLIDRFHRAGWRDSARDALARIGAPAVPALIGILNGPDPEMQSCAADALAEVGPAAQVAVPALIHVIEHPVATDAGNTLLRSCVRAFGRIGPPAKAAVPALSRLLVDDTEIEQSAVVEALDSIGAPPVRELLQSFLRTGSSDVADMLAGLGPNARAAVPELRKELGDRLPQLRYSAALALAYIEPSAAESMPVLTEALSQDQNVDRSQVVAALGRLGPRAQVALPKLVQLITEGSSNPDIFSALVRIDPEGKQSVSALISALSSPYSDAVVGAADCLGLLGPRAKAAVPALARVVAHVFEQDDGTIDYRPPESAAKALRRIGPRARCAIPILAHALNRPVCGQRAAEGYGCEHLLAAAAETLGSFGPAGKAAVPALIELAQIPGTDDAAFAAREAAVLALGQIGPDAIAAAPVLRKRWQARESDVRIEPAILVALIQLDPSGKSLAEKWLAENAGIDQKGREKFGSRYADSRAMVLGALRRTSVESEWLARHYLDGLDSMFATFELETDATPVDWNGSPSSDVEDWFASLGRCGPAARAAIPRLKKYLNHPSPFVRLWATEAIQKIASPVQAAGNAEPPQ